MALSDLVEATLDLLFPSRCGGCQMLLDSRTLFCASCGAVAERLGHPRCVVCAVPFEGPGEDHHCGECLAHPPAFETVRAPYLYGGPVARAVCDLKYAGRTDLAVPLGHEMLQTVGVRSIDRVVPVPLHPRRLRARGFNQAALLAEPIAAALGVRFDTTALVRRRETMAQAKLGRAERRLNVRGAFAVPARSRERVEGERVLVVDDVVTTGETVAACARALRRAGAAEVEVAAVARAMW